VGLYLIYPVLRPWIRSAREQDYQYFFAAWFVGALLYKIIWVFFGVSIGVYFELFSNNCGYFVLGYYLGNKTARVLPGGPDISGGSIQPWPFSEKQLLQIAIGLIALGCGITAVGTWWASKTYGGTFHTYFYDYLTPNCAMAAAGWFLLAKWAWNKRPLFDFEKEFAAASFGIYFIHVLVMDWWGWVGYWQTKIHPAIGVLLVTCLVSLLSFMAIAAIRSLPAGQKIT
jgi:surface polysaccharide O-acyltransferase-like enzyme